MPSRHPLLENVTTTATGASWAPNIHEGGVTFHASGTTSAGAGSATILVEVSNDNGETWLTQGTITLTLGTVATGDGYASTAPWNLYRGRVTAISGTDATVSLYAGV